MADAHQQSASNVPIPDPSTLTTQQLDKEIEHLRELIDTQLDNMKARSAEVAAAQALAVQEALAASDKATKALEASLTRRLEAADALTLSRLDGVGKEFVTYRSLLDSLSATTRAALEAADKAVGKAETNNEKRFEQLATAIAGVLEQLKSTVTRAEFDTLRATVTEKIDDLKGQALRGAGHDEGSQIEARLTAIAKQIDHNSTAIIDRGSRTAGLKDGWGYLVGLVGVVATVIAVVVTLAGR